MTVFEIIVILLLAATNFFVFLLLGITNTICNQLKDRTE